MNSGALKAFKGRCFTASIHSRLNRGFLEAFDKKMTSKELGKFYIGDVLSVTKCRFLSPAGIVGINDMLEFMIGSKKGRKMLKYPLFDIAKICRPYIFAQYPQLEGIDDSAVNYENSTEWLLEQIKIHGEKFTIQPLPAEVDIEKELRKTQDKDLP